MAKSLSELEKPLFRFGSFELDPHERRLCAHGRPLTLTPKVFDTLVLLVERAGRVVGKDELMQALWPRGFVDESNLTKHIWLIRKVLDDGGGDTCIETVPKHGYRFTAAVECVARTPAAGFVAAHAHEAIASAAGDAATVSQAKAGSATPSSAAQPNPAHATAIALPKPAPARRRQSAWIAFAAR